MDFVYPHLSIYQMNSWVTSSLRPLEILLAQTFMCKKNFLMPFFADMAHGFPVPQPGIEPVHPVLRHQNLNPGLPSEGPVFVLIDKPSFFLDSLATKGEILGSYCEHMFVTLFWKK